LPVLGSFQNAAGDVPEHAVVVGQQPLQGLTVPLLEQGHPLGWVHAGHLPCSRLCHYIRCRGRKPTGIFLFFGEFFPRRGPYGETPAIFPAVGLSNSGVSDIILALLIRNSQKGRYSCPDIPSGTTYKRPRARPTPSAPRFSPRSPVR